MPAEGAGYGREVWDVCGSWIHGMLASPWLVYDTQNFSKIAVAYIDPGNYSTDVAAGATYRFKLLFIVLMSNVFAIFLQSLCIKFGSVSGLNLAEACREFLPTWLNISLYIMAEAAVSFSSSKFRFESHLTRSRSSLRTSLKSSGQPLRLTFSYP